MSLMPSVPSQTPSLTLLTCALSSATSNGHRSEESAAEEHAGTHVTEWSWDSTELKLLRVIQKINKTFTGDVVVHSNPTIYKLLIAVQLEQSSTEGKIASYRQGRH